MGITNSTYSGYETGKRQPDVAKIKQLAGIFHISGDILLETGYKDCKPPSQEPGLEELSSLYQSLRPEYQECALDMIRRLARLQSAD